VITITATVNCYTIVIFGLHHYECSAPLVTNASTVVSSGSGQLLQSMTTCGSWGRFVLSSS